MTMMPRHPHATEDRRRHLNERLLRAEFIEGAEEEHRRLTGRR